MNNDQFVSPSPGGPAGPHDDKENINLHLIRTPESFNIIPQKGGKADAVEIAEREEIYQQSQWFNSVKKQ